jgi:hypothetical protein
MASTRRSVPPGKPPEEPDDEEECESIDPEDILAEDVLEKPRETVRLPPSAAMRAAARKSEPPTVPRRGPALESKTIVKAPSPALLEKSRKDED